MNINELEAFFKSAELPATLQLDVATKIVDVPRFVASHLAVLKQNPNNPGFSAFYMRLEKARELIMAQS